MNDSERIYELETHRVIYNNVNGAKITVRPDADALGLVEVDGGDDFGRIIVEPKAAVILAKAIASLASEMLALGAA